MATNVVRMTDYVPWYGLQAAVVGLRNDPRSQYSKPVQNVLSKLEAEYERLTIALAHGVADYLFAASLGEARHVDHATSRGERIRLVDMTTNGNTPRNTVYNHAHYFDVTKTSQFLVDLFDGEHWDTSFGGSKWADIARAVHMYETGVLDDVAFLDHAADLEHNGGCAFSKNNPFFALDCPTNTFKEFLDWKFRSPDLARALVISGYGDTDEMVHYECRRRSASLLNERYVTLLRKYVTVRYGADTYDFVPYDAYKSFASFKPYQRVCVNGTEIPDYVTIPICTYDGCDSKAQLESRYCEYHDGNYSTCPGCGDEVIVHETAMLSTKRGILEFCGDCYNDSGTCVACSADIYRPVRVPAEFRVRGTLCFECLHSHKVTGICGHKVSLRVAMKDDPVCPKCSGHIKCAKCSSVGDWRKYYANSLHNNTIPMCTHCSNMNTYNMGSCESCETQLTPQTTKPVQLLLVNYGKDARVYTKPMCAICALVDTVRCPNCASTAVKLMLHNGVGDVPDGVTRHDMYCVACNTVHKYE